jgi:hypothetical protein
MPYRDSGLNQIYGLLFCRDLDAYRSQSGSADVYPWSVLFKSDPDDAGLRKIVNDDSLETRPKILAANLLRARNHPVAKGRIFGIVVEVGIQQGRDTLAVYEDGTARYINYSEKMIVWDTSTDESTKIVSDLFSKSRKVFDKIGKLEAERNPILPDGAIRMTFLSSDGVYVGEGPFDLLSNDAMAGPVVSNAAQLMSYLVSKSGDASE